jgi:hypothetical protein
LAATCQSVLHGPLYKVVVYFFKVKGEYLWQFQSLWLVLSASRLLFKEPAD